MTQYYYTDGKERYGPFTLEELRIKNITPDTLVWKEGMADWLPASQVSELSLTSTDTAFSTPAIPTFTSNALPEPQPKNWLVESILVTLLCCLPFGIIGIIHATKVESLWVSGQRDAAVKASQEAAKWVKIGFFAGIIAIGLSMLLMFMGIITSAGLGGGFSQ